MEHGLATLLAPMPLGTFFGTVWGRRHHHARSTPERFSGLLPDRRLEEVLATLHPQPDMLRMVRQGQTLPLPELLLPGGAIDIVQLRNRYAEGYTIVLNGVERFVPEVRRLTNAIALDCDYETQVNLYATPPAAQGFTPHFDDHDVLVLQLRGTKTWHVHLSTPIVVPERFRQRERAVDTALLGIPERLGLAPGDVLYLPRGLIHAAETEGTASVHLTIGFHPPNLLGLLLAGLEARAQGGGLLLEQAPPGYLSDGATRRGLAAVLRGLAAELDDDDVARGLAICEDRLIKTGRCGISGDLFGAGARRLSEDSVVQRSAPIPARVVDLGGSLGFQFAQSLVVGERDHRAAFTFLCTNEAPFRVGDLPGLVPAARIALAAKLLLDGFLLSLS